MTRSLYIDTEIDPALRESDYVTLSGSEGRHAATVRRTKVGDQIDVVNGRGLRLTIEVDEVSKTDVGGRVLTAVQELTTQPRIVVVQALAKGGRDEQAIETCTEFGADVFIPWMSDRTIVRWSDPRRAEKGRAKLANTAWAAAKQSRRAFVPEVEAAVTTKQLAERVREFPGQVYLCHE